MALSWHKGSCQGTPDNYSVKAYFQKTNKKLLQKEVPWESGQTVNLQIIITFSTVRQGQPNLQKVITQPSASFRGRECRAV